MFRFKLLFVVLSVWCLRCAECKNNFFVAKKWGFSWGVIDSYVCVTNTSFALTWILNEYYHIYYLKGSRFLPITNFKLDCVISSFDNNCVYNFVKPPWYLKKSLASDVVLDSRWESMKIVRTEDARPHKEKLKFEEVLSTLKDDFEIPLSLLITYEAHIFLCDGYFPPDSNCYWFMLQAWRGTRSAVRKCNRNSIHPLPKYSPTSDCAVRRAEVNHTIEDFSHYISEKEWSHFKLVKKSNHLLLNKVTQHGNKKILELYDNDDEIFNVTHMIIHSKYIHGLWKIHELEYIQTEESNVSVNFNLTMEYIPENSLCISMFLSMCTSCSLKTTLFDRHGNMVNSTFYQFKHPGWSQVTLSYNNVESVSQLRITTVGRDNNQFWAIDELKQCHNKGYRMISLSEKAKCQLMSGENNTILIDERGTEDDIDIVCPEDTIGEFCVPCKWLRFPDCKNIKICSKHESTDTKCFCSAGYMSKTCDYECEIGRYGHGCKNTCDNCLDNVCNKTNGYCEEKCNNDYYALPKCDIPNGITFKLSPSVIKISDTEATILVNNFEIINTVNELPSFYMVQYKKALETNWTNLGFLKKFNESSIFTVYNLQAKTEYNVRSVIINYKKEKFLNPVIPFTSFVSLCQVSSDTFNISSNSDETITVKVLLNEICENLENYNLILLVSDEDSLLDQGLENFNLPKQKIVFNCSLNNITESELNLIVGNRKGTSQNSCQLVSENSALQPGTLYNISIILVNEFSGPTRYYYFSKNCKTQDEKIKLEFLTLLLLFIIPVAIIIFLIRRKRVSSNMNSPSTENIQMIQKGTDDQDANFVKKNKHNKVTISNFSKPIEVDKFEKYVKQLEEDGSSLKKQFTTFLCEASKTIYETLDQFYDYIDMEFIDGTKISNSYVITEVPKNNDIGNFWKNVWEDNVEHIVLFGEIGLRKRDQYWPEQNEKLTYQKLLIQLIYTKEFQFMTYRKFILIIDDIVKQVDQIHFSYTGLNPQKYSPLFKKMSKLQLKISSPVLVHSSIGIGGVGFVLLCDMCLRTAMKEKLIDVVGFLQKLRNYKSGMIRNVEQYKLVHQVILFVLQGCKFNLELQNDYVNF